MERINWEDSDIKEIKIEMKSYRNNISARLSTRLGVDKQSVKEKIREIKSKLGR